MGRLLSPAVLFVVVVLAILGLGTAFSPAAVSQTTDAEAPATAPAASAERPAWALAIHGGAGVISKEMPEETKRGYREALEGALELGRKHLAAGGTALDAVEKVVVFLENDPRFNAGKGAVYTHEKTHELDAAIMDGRDRSAGAVASLKTVKNPIRLARAVMERSPHVFMVGEGAEAFADGLADLDLERVPNSYFDTEHRREALERALEAERARGAEESRKEAAEGWEQGDDRGDGGESDGPLGDKKMGTVGAVALDTHGHLASATSTGGLTNKRFGRVGDVPVIGAGTWADDATCAISATGQGEKFIRNTVAVRISALMAYRGLSLEEAAREVVHRVLEPGDGGVIGVSHDGSIALVFNSAGMFRGAADASGRFEVGIWEEMD